MCNITRQNSLCSVAINTFNSVLERYRKSLLNLIHALLVNLLMRIFVVGVVNDVVDLRSRFNINLQQQQQQQLLKVML